MPSPHWESTALDAYWDTGASLTVVDRTWAAQHPDAVRIGEDSAPGIDSSGAEVPSADGELAPFSCGGHPIAGGPCVVVDLSGLNQHLTDPIHLFLGLPQMLGLEWWFDLTGHRWAVSRPTTSDGARS